MFLRQTPGACPICGAAHTACTPGGGAALTIVQLPARDQAATPPLQAEVVQAGLPLGSFTTGTYRRSSASAPKAEKA